MQELTWIGNLLLIVCLAAGHTELHVTFVNRVHGLAWSERRLRTIRRVHDLAVPLGPLALLLGLGIFGARLLRGGSWADLCVVSWIVTGVCAIGFLGLIWSSIRWLTHRAPAVRTSFHSERVHIGRRFESILRGGGPYEFLLNVPGNEILDVEFTKQELQLPAVPAEWDGLRILHLTDVHLLGTLRQGFYEEVLQIACRMPPDLIVFTGDLIDNMECVDWLPTTLGRLKARWGCYFILGNHDWEQQPEPIRVALCDLGWTDVSRRAVDVHMLGRRMTIAGTERPWLGEHPHYATTLPAEDEFRLLLSHTPDNIAWARNHGVHLMLSGHNHGGQVRLPVIGPVYSPSLYGVRYASGMWYEQPTLLSVCRGLSGKHPLRWRCPPEVATLILASPVKPSAEPSTEAAELV